MIAGSGFWTPIAGHGTVDAQNILQYLTNKQCKKIKKNTDAAYRINLWFPSMCQSDRGAGTLYCRLGISFRCIPRSIVPTGSTALRASQILRRCTL